MALDTGLYPVQGKLILTPTAYGSGGTDLGIVQAGSLAGFVKEHETYTLHPSGATAGEARIVGINVLFQMTLIDWSPTLFSLLWSNMQSAAEAMSNYGSNYKLGHLLGDNETSKLMVRPVDDAGTFDANKPLFYARRAVVVGLMPVVFDRVINHLEPLVINVLCLKHSSETLPFRYGNSATLPVFA